MPYVWDGHDNATRVQETGHGFKLDRYNWTEEELQDKIMAMLTDKKMKAKLKKTSKSMRSKHGPTKAAKVIDGLTAAARCDRMRSHSLCPTPLWSFIPIEIAEIGSSMTRQPGLKREPFVFGVPEYD